MPQFLIFIFGLAAGIAVGQMLAREEKPACGPRSPGRPRTSRKTSKLVAEQAAEKEAKKKKILEMFESRERLANDEIEQALGISDATATRYLDELEKEGRLRQVGVAGRHVYYQKAA